MKAWEKLQARSVRKRLAKLEKVDRLPEKIRLKYPQYEVGAGTYGVPYVRQFGDEAATLRIGAYTSIADNVTILLGGNHRTDWISNYPFPMVFDQARHIEAYSYSKGDVIIGSDCWIGERVTILSGVTIGHGAVVAAGAVVSKSVEPYAIVGGNPCKHIRWRFDQATREQLLASQWWAWPSDEVGNISPLLCSADFEAFFSYVRERGGPAAVQPASTPRAEGGEGAVVRVMRR